jgi:hypothetical protein
MAILKRKFIEVLEVNGEIASHAFKSLGLARRTAY